MVDALGRAYCRGVKNGKRGKPGTPGINVLSSFMPKSLVNLLQKYDEECCFTLTDLERDIQEKSGVIKQWNSRTFNNQNLLMEKSSSGTEEVSPGRYALLFKTTRFANDDIILLPNHANTSGFLCITFQADGEMEQTLISSYQNPSLPFHEIEVTRNDITLMCADHSEFIQHKCHEWTTLFLSYHALLHTTTWNYIINKDPKMTGSFNTKSIDEAQSACSIGSRFDNSKFLNGKIASFEMYHRKGEEWFPDPLKQILIGQQLISKSIKDMDESV